VSGHGAHAAGDELAPLGDALAEVLAACTPRAAVAVPAAEAVGLVAAVDAVAVAEVPPFANSAMDGYAVRAADVAAAPVDLVVAGTVRAGQVADVAVGPGQAVRIMTGAPLPPGADAVVMVERTAPLGDGGVRIEVPVEVATHVRPAGDDVRAGQVVVVAGTELRPAHLGLLVASGLDEVVVVPRPRVGVLSTGDELLGGAGGAGIPDANRPVLLALVADAGGVPVDLGVVPDDEGALARAAERAAARCDVVISSGGVSVGDFDHVAAVLGGAGSARTWRLAIKPAKPFVFATLGGVPWFGLPGNPVSSIVSFELLARPALRRLRGVEPAVPPRLRARVGRALRRRPDGKVHLVRVTVSAGPDGVPVVDALDAQGSHQLSGAAGADALAVVPDGDGLAPGADVEVVPLAGWAYR
jgi:molybdopterin molybdotransferase